ncbi:MAG: 16S rRNA (adenine(1518)-N(6)/adenine(1519)-N(6))-dimethyltransferase RsmA [Candidatus Omnitrophica bacterium]|nr:16S rRNA (adenine(1518)-N(6)/adenine(1519)-N(6))-dimethyltransferase RsmA [Candidatus Omnitrophota bacterium]
MNSREIKEIVRRYRLGISPRRMGQNFLVDPRVLSRIVETVGVGPRSVVVEIGAGLGALTAGLLETGAMVYAVEKDAGFLRVLTDRFKDQDRLQLIQSDVLKLDLGSYASGRPKELLITGNIPYSLTSSILEFLLRQRRWVKRAVLTVQREVAVRVTAQPGTKAYASISLLAQVAFMPSVAFTIAPSCFYPQPKVTSAVLQLDPVDALVVAPEEEERVLRLGRQLFTHRRKTLLNSLCLCMDGQDKERLMQQIAAAGLDPVRRPETLSLQDLVRLARILSVK